MTRIVLVCMLAGLSSFACAQEPVPSRKSDAAGAKLQHLLRAADHLEAAGEIEQARSLRQRADAERLALLDRLESLQAELDRLRQIVGSAPQILVQVRMMELSHTRLRNLGFDTAKLGEAGLPDSGWNNRAPSGFRVIEADGRFLQVLKALREDNLVKVLAEPTLVTLSGRPAHFNVGGEYPVMVPQSDGSQEMQYREYGTRVDLQANLLGNGRIRLEVRPRVSELVPEHGIQVGQHTFPGLRVRQVDTAVEMQADQTLIISGLRQTRVTNKQSKPAAETDTPNPNAKPDEVTEETELLVMITPRIVESAVASATRLPATRQAIK